MAESLQKAFGGVSNYPVSKLSLRFLTLNLTVLPRRKLNPLLALSEHPSPILVYFFLIQGHNHSPESYPDSLATSYPHPRATTSYSTQAASGIPPRIRSADPEKLETRPLHEFLAPRADSTSGSPSALSRALLACLHPLATCLKQWASHPPLSSASSLSSCTTSSTTLTASEVVVTLLLSTSSTSQSFDCIPASVSIRPL